MILAEFSKYLQKHNQEILTRNTMPIELLQKWLITVINKNPKNHIERIIHKEIMYCENENGDYTIIGKSDSGRVLVSALIKFAKSYDNYTYSKWKDITEKMLNKE